MYCHFSCFQSFSENENECPACLPNNKKLLDIIRAQEQSRDLHETFHSLLDRAEDPFSLVADYFGRGVFKKLMVITDTDKSLSTASTKFEEPKLNYGPGAEARIRLTEGKNTTLGKISFVKEIFILICHYKLIIFFYETLKPLVSMNIFLQL